MAFHKSSQNISVTDGLLLATCRDCAGQNRNSEISLDAYLGNANGFFEWGGGGFSRSARECTVRQDGDSLYLYARLRTQHKSWRNARVNLSDRITNSNGVLVYIGGKEPHIEHSRDFLGEQTDFLSTAISDTISDLRELFSSNSLFDGPLNERSDGGRFTPETHPDASRRNDSAASEESPAHNPQTHVEDLVSSTQTSILKAAKAPPAYDSKGTSEKTKLRIGEQPLRESSGSRLSSDAPRTVGSLPTQIEYCSEETATQKIKDFLFHGNGKTIHSSNLEDGKRTFELWEEGSRVRIVQVEESILFDQDKVRRDSISAASVRSVMTPSVVDGEDEYDFLD